MNAMRTPQQAWMLSLALLVLVWAALAALLHPTALSMVEIWERSETFAHGYVILPIALWLVWRARHHLAAVETAPDLRALWLALPLLAGWLVARAGGVLVVEQYAFVGLWLTAVWALFGLRLVRATIFPLLFLLLMVPNGEFLIPPLIEFTADFTVGALTLIGIPVFREGPFFTIPSGDWNVVEGCSGLRYLIASITLGTLYAYLTYRTLWKRIAFSLAAVVVPVIANGFRATMIVLIAHYSDMKLALGVDHFIYGWVWFGIVMLLMFWVGLIWREDLAQEPEAPPALAPRPPLRMAAMLLAMAALFPLWEGWLNARPIQSVALAAPPATAGWQQAAPFADWQPHWVGMDAKLSEYYSKDGDTVLLFTAYYARQRQDAELINSQNYMVPQKDLAWQNVGETVRSVSVAGQSLTVRQAKLRSTSGGPRILAWQWNRVQGEDVLNPYLIKLRLALTKVLGGEDDGTAFIVAAPYRDRQDEAEKVLTEFIAEMRPGLEALADRP